MVSAYSEEICCHFFDKLEYLVLYNPLQKLLNSFIYLKDYSTHEGENSHMASY